MAKRIGKPAPDGPLFKDFAIDDHADFVIETSTGWIRSLTHTRKSRVDAGFQQETIEITRKSNRGSNASGFLLQNPGRRSL